jgi:hypothetical protein
MIRAIVEIMAMVEGFSYAELRHMPLDELKLVQDEVIRIAKLRRQAARQKG